ncbi:MAG: transporter substrate-binding protein [Candidatus Schekmanbacteria bacterium]|nr:transporter substrate-binding protein [Candidatus Schekmanbacteria bacterium]
MTAGHKHRTVTIGLLHSLTGNMSVSERMLLDAELMAIDEINSSGGVLDCRIEPLIADGASVPSTFARKANELISAGVSSIFGCWTSASRKAVKPVVESNNHLLWYPVQYEGLEESPNIVYTGTCVNQQIEPALDWLIRNIGRRIFLVGSDYVFPRTANKLIRALTARRNNSTTIVGEEYISLDCMDFTGVIAKIQKAKPDAVFNTINGESNSIFYGQYHEAGITSDKIPILAVSVAELELKPVVSMATGHLACWNYFQSLDNKENKKFLTEFRKRYGVNCICSASGVLAYSQIYLWKNLVQAERSFDASLISQRVSGCEFESPAGLLKIGPNRHVPLPAYIGRLRNDGEFEILWDSNGTIQPLPWLGIEEIDIPASGVVKEILAAYPDMVDYNVNLNREAFVRKQAEIALQRLNENLEKKIKERTAELERVNEQLISKLDDHKRIEEALHESEGKFRSFSEQAFVGVYLAQGKSIKYVNPKFADIFGYTVEECLNKISFLDLIYPEDIAMVEEQVRKRMSGKIKFVNYSFRGVKKNKEIINLEVYGSTVIYNGKPATTGTILDITERKKIEEQLRQAQKMEGIGHLAGGVAHDFNNILTAIIGYGSILKNKIPVSDPLHAHVNHILVSSEKAASLTHSLLAFSRKQMIDLQPVNMNDIVFGLQNILNRVITENIEIKVITTGTDLIVKADRNQIEQVIINLATNARDAMPNGGRLIIATGEVEIDEQFIKAHHYGEAGKYAVLSVTDTGVGMDEKTREQIFEPFYTTKEVGKGTGLGLSMVYGTIKQHDGFINVYSETGEGTIFRIYLPLSESSFHHREDKAPTAIPSGNETILLVEDNEAVRNVIRLLLEEFGYKVFEATDGDESIRVFSEYREKINLIISDIIMPKKNGREMFGEVKKIKPGIKALFMSGYSADVISQNGVLDKDMHFIQKPSNPSDLLKKIREVLDT